LILNSGGVRALPSPRLCKLGTLYFEPRFAVEAFGLNLFAVIHEKAAEMMFRRILFDDFDLRASAFAKGPVDGGALPNLGD
jgi:hypothetical protein